MVGREITPKVFYAAVPEIYDYVTLHCKWNFVDVIKGMDLEMGRLSCFIWAGNI